MASQRTYCADFMRDKLHREAAQELWLRGKVFAMGRVLIWCRNCSGEGLMTGTWCYINVLGNQSWCPWCALKKNKHQVSSYTILVFRVCLRSAPQISHTVTWDCLKKAISNRFVAHRNIISAAYAELVSKGLFKYKKTFYPKSPGLPWNSYPPCRHIMFLEQLKTKAVCKLIGKKYVIVGWLWNEQDGIDSCSLGSWVDFLLASF